MAHLHLPQPLAPLGKALEGLDGAAFVVLIVALASAAAIVATFVYM